MKLYFSPRTRATRHRWLLEELEVPYELVRLDLSKQENRTPAYLALNPFGEVPVLVDGDVTLFESSAIFLHLADRLPEKHLAPPPGSPERGPYLQWVLFAEVTLEPVVLEHHRNSQLPAEQKTDLAKQHARLDEVLTVIDTRLGGREFAVGNAFTAADLVLASILHLANTLKLLASHPRLVDYVMRHTMRPATRRAVAG
ncbi:MAG: glutathione S-transferase family protein [Myxococcaceae bacterium]|nr:MAG: glutathione S-transferase family protein [Myxococcaceae bacterium]